MANRTEPRVILLQPDALGEYHELLVGTDGSPLAPTSSSGASIATLLQNQDILSYLGVQGKTFTAGPSSAINATATGQTSFAATTPTFLLNVPSGKTAVPLYISLAQAGSVAGGDITVLVGKDRVNRYSSGSTTLSAVSDRPGKGVLAACTLYVNPTATSGVAVRMAGVQMAPDISPAEGVINEWVWTPAGKLDYLDGPAALMVYTYAASTGPTWLYSFGWAEVDTADLP